MPNSLQSFGARKVTVWHSLFRCRVAQRRCRRGSGRPPAAGDRRFALSGQDQWHVTLRFFGELDPGDVGLATEAVGLAAQGLDQPIVVHGGPGARFLGPV